MRPQVFLLISVIACMTERVKAQATLVAADSAEIRRANSKLFDEYASTQTAEQYAEEKLRKDPNSPVLMVRAAGEEHYFPGTTVDTARESYLRSAAANSDLIVVAEPQSRISDYTDFHRFIFSDYVLTVDSVVSSKGVTVLPGQKIVVSRPGGIVPYGKTTIVGSVPEFELFHLKEPYALFLRLLPNGSFVVFDESAYRLSEGKIYARHHHIQGELISKSQFLEDLDAIRDWLKKEIR